jgi:hypothetical protein
VSTTRNTIAALFAAAVVVALSGCGSATPSGAGPSATQSGTAAPQAPEVNPQGDIPDNQAFVAYTAADRSFTVKYPEGWAQTQSGSTVTFSDKFNSITLAPHPGFYQPTEAYARSVEVPQIASTTVGFVAGKVSTVARPAGQVILITYQADSPPSPVTGKSVHQAVERYEFSQSGRGVVATLAGPVGADNVDPWRIVTDSFTWLP